MAKKAQSMTDRILVESEDLNLYAEGKLKELRVVIERAARIDLLIKIANNEGWEESAYVYCTEPEIALSPNEFEKLRHSKANLRERGLLMEEKS